MMISPPLYDIRDHYWIVAGDGTKVWSSSRAAYVPVSDADYAAWLGPDSRPTSIDTEANLRQVFVDDGFLQGWPLDLSAYAASARYAKETGGITVNGMAVATDRGSQALITGAWATVQINPKATVSWKAADGSFVTLDAAAITALATAVTDHVQACFAAEATIGQGITAGTTKTTADIDKALAAVTG